MTEYTTLGNLITPAKVIRCGKGSYPVLSMTMHDGIVLQSDRFKKSLASIDQSDYKVVKYGQLVVGFPIDEGVLYIQKAAPEGIMSPAYNVWDVDTTKIDADYLELCLHSPQSMQYYSDKLRGTTARRRSIPTADLLALPIRLPSFEEQRAAVAIYAKMNTVIADRQQQLVYLDQLVKSRFIELFGDPMNVETKWRCSTIGEEFSVTSGGTPSTDVKAYWDQGTIPWIGSNLCQDVILYENDGKFITDAGYEHSSAKWFYSGTVLVALVGATIGKTALLRFNTTTNQNIAGIDVNKNQNFTSEFVYYHVQMQYDKFMELGNGKFKMANQGFIRQLPLICPPIELQEQFTAFVEQTDKSKLAVQQGLQELEILKKSLMQQYFG